LKLPRIFLLLFRKLALITLLQLDSSWKIETMSTPKNASSARIKEQQARRVLDSAARQRRARKALESLEQDNSHEDPHADLVMSKKALSLFQVLKGKN
jgi:hypothetical protein